jgi:hypothetical protein
MMPCIADPTQKDEFKIYTSSNTWSLYDMMPALPSMYNCGSKKEIYTKGAKVIILRDGVGPEVIEPLKTAMCSNHNVSWYIIGTNASIATSLFTDGGFSGGIFSPMTPLARELEVYAIYSAYHRTMCGTHDLPLFYVLDDDIVVKYVDSELYLTGVFEYDSRGVNAAYSPDSVFFKQIMNAHSLNNRQTQPPTAIRRLSTLISSAMFEQDACLRLGGNLDVMNRNLDIIEDVVLAIGLGVEHGVIDGGGLGLYEFIIDRLDTPKGHPLEFLKHIVADVNKNSLLTNSPSVVDIISGTPAASVADLESNLASACHATYILQPATIIPTFFKAFEKHLLRLAHTDQALIR